MSPLLKNILFGLGLALVVWLGYTVFIKDDEEQLASENALVASEAAREAQEFLRKLQQLRTINLDSSLFTDPRFRALVDYRQDVTEEPAGRTNPFAPIGQ